MADQPGAGQLAGVGQEAALAQDAALAPASYIAPESFHGRPVSWVAVSIVMAGFLAGGLGLVIGPTWWLFWAGGAMVVIGGLLALGTHIFEDWY
jgi:hypothetical protein